MSRMLPQHLHCCYNMHTSISTCPATCLRTEVQFNVFRIPKRNVAESGVSLLDSNIACFEAYPVVDAVGKEGTRGDAATLVTLGWNWC